MVIRLMELYGIRKVYVETNRDTLLPGYLRLAADGAGYKINIKPVHNTMKKIDRVQLSLENQISVGNLHRHETLFGDHELHRQMLAFPYCMGAKSKNDFIDATAFGVLHLRKLPPGVIVEGILQDFGHARSHTAIRAGHAHGNVYARTSARAA